MTTTRNIHFPFSIFHFSFPLLLCAFCIATTGCVHHGYGTGDEENFDTPRNATQTDLTRTSKQMVADLLASQAFKAKYEEVKRGLGAKLPAIQVGNFWNDVTPLGRGDDTRQFTPKLETCRGAVREALQNSGFFRLVDDAGAYGSSAEEIKEGLVADVDEGLASPRNIQNAGNYTPADFRMIAHFSRVKDGDRYYFNLKVEVHDLATREIWTTTRTFTKF